jgi:hypothetical protein
MGLFGLLAFPDERVVGWLMVAIGTLFLVPAIFSRPVRDEKTLHENIKRYLVASVTCWAIGGALYIVSFMASCSTEDELRLLASAFGTLGLLLGVLLVYYGSQQVPSDDSDGDEA